MSELNDYSSLSLDIKREILTNSAALHMACNFIAQHTGEPIETWVEAFSQRAGEETERLTDVQVEAAIAAIDEMRDRVNNES